MSLVEQQYRRESDLGLFPTRTGSCVVLSVGKSRRQLRYCGIGLLWSRGCLGVICMTFHSARPNDCQ
jgi:hypothetical protein